MIRPGAVLILIALSACRQDMAQQPKYTLYEPSVLWQDGASARPRVPGTVARGDGKAQQTPPPTPALLARGRERYDIFCVPCHGLTGEGNGRVVQRGFPAPPSYLSARLRGAPARHFYDVISKGYGIMYPYGDRVSPKDRWAIVAYIRALQQASPQIASDHPARDAIPWESRDAD